MGDLGFFGILKQGKEIEKYSVPNGSVKLEVHSFVEKKLLNEEIYLNRFKPLYNLLHNSLRETIGLIQSKYGALPGELQPAEKIWCLFVSRETLPTFSMWARRSEMGLIIPLDLLNLSENYKNMKHHMMHECLHSCAKMHHKEEDAIQEIKKHQEELRASLEKCQAETLNIVKSIKEFGGTYNYNINREVDLFTHEFLVHFGNYIADIGIDTIVSLLNLEEYIGVDLDLTQRDNKNLDLLIPYLEENKSKMNLGELNYIEFCILVWNMPLFIFPYVYNKNHRKKAIKLIREYFRIVKKIDPEVQKLVRRIYAGFFKVIKPHKIDLYESNFDVKKIIHTVESIDAAKALYTNLVRDLEYLSSHITK